MRKKLILLAMFMATLATNAQVGIGTTNPDASAALDVESTTQGFLPPRMLEAEMNAIASPAEGLIVYCTDCTPKGLYVNTTEGTADWESATGGSGGGGGNEADLVAAIVAVSTNPAADGTPTLLDLALAGVTGATLDQAIYEEAIADASPVPTTLAELQAIIDAINASPGIPGNSTCPAGTLISTTACTAGELASGIGTNASDGQPYDVVQIGDQCWMAENIDNGVADSGGWVNNSDTGWNGYYDTTFQADKEGTLFQWSAAMNGSTAERAQGVCPTGWHIPSDCEWMYLENTLGMSTAQQETTGWRGTDQGTQLKSGGSSGFEGLLAGYRHTTGSFSSRGTFANYWSSSESGSTAYRRTLDSSSATVYRNTNDKAHAWSVRCLKD